MTAQEQRAAAKQFTSDWTGKGYEKGESQSFWLALLRNVYGVEQPEHYITFEEQVHLDHTSFIDGYIDETKVMIEQKSIDKDLKKPIKQSDGAMLSPFQQAKRYISELPRSKHPKYVVCCNFKEFHVYDMENPQGEPEVVLLENLEKEYTRLSFLVDNGSAHIRREMEISFKAGDIVGKLYDELLKQYPDPDDNDLQNLNMLCVRLVFCLYAEDAGVFDKHDQFYDYLKDTDIKHFRKDLKELFEVLDTKPEDRDKFLEPALAAFPYVNGGLFKGEVEIPPFTEELKELLLEKGSADIDWSDISPTIFGAVFESTLNPETRRSGGMHYTSIENIHKVIDPLFLDELKAEFETIKAMPEGKKRNNALYAFQDKLASLRFLDPACGSGNFLTETYISLRRLENDILRELTSQITLGDAASNPVKVTIQQFYGIEINDFAVTVAKTALWIAESQMLTETKDIVHSDIDFLPLKTNAYIVEGNALRLDWEEIVPANELSYIMGNPPFIGARLMSAEQKKDVLAIFDGVKNNGNLDYVSCWYKKAADFMIGTSIRAALVSTNSITQGEQVAILWKNLFSQGIHIDFAHRTFRWDSEANIKAHVHCVIIGFSAIQNKPPYIYIYISGRKIAAQNINAYLLDAPNIFIESRSKPLCDVPEIGIGNKPIDGGNYLFTEEEMQEFIKAEPKSAPYFKQWYGSQEFINRKPRYCLWLGDCSPAELRKMPHCMERVEAVRKFRLESTSAGTRKIADKPTRFHVENMPKSTYVVIPEVSSERRRYIPMGFMQPDIFCSNLVKIIPNANLYHFGILTSNVHMAWVRAVCGRLKSDYRYSKDIVYNNFPWCDPTPEQKARIGQTAQAILDARAKYPDCSLADLYDEAVMPSELRKAHQDNDRAVMAAYGLSVKDTTEADCVAFLFKKYRELTEK